MSMPHEQSGKGEMLLRRRVLVTEEKNIAITEGMTKF